jgi:hypothetical protein
MPHFCLNPRRLAGALAATACTVLTASAPALAASPLDEDGAASAITTAASTAECAAPSLLQPFSSWKDNRHYVLAPGASFEDPAGGGWQLGNGARIVQETNPDGTVDGVLDLPTGAVAISPTMCVDLDYPTARTWVRTVAGDGDVGVSVIYDAGKKAHVAHAVGHVHGDKQRGWGLSGDVKIQPELAGKKEGWRRVAFVLTGGGKSAEFQLDDFYVDPRMVR